MADLILHHYPPSPVSEKIRTALGLKKLSWTSVEENRLPDRPELFAMTGGYRRIPVLQIGADIYCDTQLIFRVLENVAPTPSFFPAGSAGLPFGLSRWADAEFFTSAMKVAFAPAIDNLPPALVADRQRLYLGPNGDLAKEREDLPHTLSQLRAQFGWLEDALAGGSDYLMGDAASMADLLAWYLYWFVSGRYAEADAFLAEFPALNLWAERMRAIGHGTSTDMTPVEALAIAKAATPTTAEAADPNDPQGLTPGMTASVAPLTDSAENPVTGTIRAVTRDSIALTLKSEGADTVCVHFPRVGYRVTPA